MLDFELPCIGPAQYGGWWANGIRHRGGLQERLVVQVAEEPLAEEQELARAVEADELDVAPVAEAVEEAGADGRAPGLLLAGQPLGQVEVVHHLVAVVVDLGLVAVVVAE